MLEHVLNLGNQLKTDLEISEGFTSIDYDRMLIVGMGGSGVAGDVLKLILNQHTNICLLYTSPSPRDRQKSRMPSSA